MTDLVTDMATDLPLKGAHFMNPIRSYRCTETHKVIQYEKMPWQSKFLSLFCPFKARQSQLRQVSIHRKLLGVWINIWPLVEKNLNVRKGIFWLEESDSSYILIHHLWKKRLKRSSNANQNCFLNLSFWEYFWNCEVLFRKVLLYVNRFPML